MSSTNMTLLTELKTHLPENKLQNPLGSGIVNESNETS
jgi:hypothetical protein